MEKLQEIFSNRELATIIWLLIIVLLLQIYDSTRNATGNLLRAFINWKIITINLVAIAYSATIVWVLWALKIWDQTLVKDTIFWFIGSGFLVLMNLNNAEKEKNFFKNILRDSIKLVLALEFVINFHQFSFLTEMFILPVIALLAMLQVVAENREKTKIVKAIIDWLFVIFALILLTISIKDIANDITGFVNYSNLWSFLIPILLSISFIPCAYLIAVFMSYEMLFVKLKIFLKNKKDLRYAKFRSLRKCGLNISKIRSLTSKVNRLYNGANREEIKVIIS